MATAQKSEAMRMYGRWVAEVVAHKPKYVKQRIKYDIKNFIAAGGRPSSSSLWRPYPQCVPE